MDSRGYPFLECNGIAVHPATHSGTALVVAAVAVVISMTKRDDHNGQGPLGPTCGYHRGLPVSPATTPTPTQHCSASAGAQSSAGFQGTGAGGMLSFHKRCLACGKPSVVALKPLSSTLRLASLAYPLVHLVLQAKTHPNEAESRWLQWWSLSG